MSRQDIEVQEALDAVDEALDHLHAAADQLGSAGRWGWFDMFAGGGLSSFVKHSKMSGAQQELRLAQIAIARLAEELRDVQGFTAIGPEVGDFLTFADFLFDNPFVDALVQQKIREAQMRVDKAIRDCERVREGLLGYMKPHRGSEGGLPSGE